MPAPISFTMAAECACCGVTPDSVECRIRSGTATLCGHSEYTTPSTPPKKYRVQTLNQDYTFCRAFSGAPACTGTASTDRDVMVNATSTYDPASCTVTLGNDNRDIYTVSGTSCPGTPVYSSTDHPGTADLDISTVGHTAFAYGFNVITETPTSILYQTNGLCYPDGGGGIIVSGSIQFQLSDEATEEEAIARLQASATWGPWQTVGGGCTNPSCCLMKYEARTAFSFAYADVECRITLGGLQANEPCRIVLELWRRPYGTGTYEQWGVVTASGVADGAGLLETDIDLSIVNDRGFETYLKSAKVFAGASA